MWPVARFFVVGAGATAVHVVVALVLNAFGLTPLWANFLAFLLAFIPSYLCNWGWTFERAAAFQPSIIRFYALSLGCFALNQTIVYVVTGWAGYPFWMALACIVATTPIISFVASKVWAFRPATHGTT